MSHRAYVRVLSHHQPIGCKTRTLVPADIADILVQRMAAERINQKTIRMMPPSSIFLPALFSCLPEITHYIPEALPPAEVENCKFVGPPNPVPHFVSTMGANAFWDWTQEPASV